MQRQIRPFLALCASIIFLAYSSHASQSERHRLLSLGGGHLLKSEVLDRKIEILISVPEEYGKTDKSYPVVFLLEGQWYFPFTHNLVERMAEQHQMPASIVIGLSMENPDRFDELQPGGERAARLVEFLKREAIPFVDRHYRTTADRTLLGWEYGGAFTLYTLAHHAELFDNYIAASPFPINAHTIDFAHSTETGPKYLFFGVSEHERTVNDGVNTLLDVLSETPIPGLSTDSYLIKGSTYKADHIRSPFALFAAGLAHAHKGYAPLRPDTAAEYRMLGSMAYVQDFYRQRAARYGTDPAIDFETLWWLFRIAMEDDDPTMMQEILNEQDIFTPALLAAYQNENRYVSYGSFLSSKGLHTEAISLLSTTTKHFPASVRAWFRLATAQQASALHQEAELSFEKAVQLAEAQNHSRLDLVKEHYNNHMQHTHN
ncbi:hypothetical protein GCM10017044_10310 [Kordiimonas sediminis]|uniref:Esterase n=1 Tax=Kordiimonas sediminis TaxID=1735581 RepID=A0A919APG9_9PROT|nr:alpha/beta hydrolase-fold protein [Kordiimonas sediminis]GHF17808.1 hypothetical protein GCM10017044_10310 [Kordiimonas sediminis]